jgi:hypothetical protein
MDEHFEDPLGVKKPKAKTDVEDVPMVPLKSTQVVEMPMKAATKALDEEEERNKKVVGIQADEETQKKILAAYKKFYAGDGEWLKKNPLPEPNKDGMLQLPFKSEQDLSKFLQSQAETKQRFLLVDAATQKVIAFSNGDGNLYKLDKDGKAKVYDGKEPLIPKPEEMASWKLPDLGKPGTEGAYKMPTQEETAELAKSKTAKLGSSEDPG